MKNRRTTANKEILLLYRFRDTEIGRQLLGVAARMGILCRAVEENQTEEMLGTLLKMPGYGAAEKEFEACENKELSRQVMIMHGFTSQRLDEFLRNMKKAGLPKIPLKAIVTPHNVNWTFRQLYEELEKEEAAYQKDMQ